MSNYWNRKDWGEVLNRHVEKMNLLFPRPPHDARFFIKVSKVPLKDFPFRAFYKEDEKDEREKD